jgi:membrane associated rhomboid family serine protease
MRYNQNEYYKPSLFGGFGFFPPVIKSLLIINVAVFLFQLFLSNSTIQGMPFKFYLEKYFALNPLSTIRFTDGENIFTFRFYIWQLFTYMFLHADFMHLFFNMFALWMFGMELEHVFGSKKFFWYYTACGLGGGVANLLLSPIFSHPGPTIGASGAVFGILLAFGLLFPDRLIFFYFLIPIKAKYFVLVYLVLEILAVGSGDMIAHLAHLGGALTGYIFILVDNKRLPFQSIFDGIKRSRRRREIFYSGPERYNEVEDANHYDIKTGKRIDKSDGEITQEVIDDILDKISKSGYQSLSSEEKRILFEASKRLE